MVQNEAAYAGEKSVGGGFSSGQRVVQAADSSAQEMYEATES
jgi:hypothetical protein